MKTQAEITQAYEQVRPLLYSLCRRFRQRHGGEWAELISEAQEQFVAACHSNQQSRGKLITWVHHKVWYGLLESQRQRAKEWARRQEIYLEEVPASSRFDFQELMKDVSEDAAAVVRLMASVPFDLLVEQRGWQHEAPGKNLRGVLIDFLVDAGWPAWRILETFREIREVLS